MIYVLLEKDQDKFMKKYKNLPQNIKTILYKSQCRNGRFHIEKENDIEYIVLPMVNDKILEKLSILFDIRCWKNVAISDNLFENKKFIEFSKKKRLNLLDGKYFFKNIIDRVIEYVLDIQNQKIEEQEVSILCKNLDEISYEKIKEIAVKVKRLNILTNNMKQFQKLEEDLYQTNGIVLNVSNNYNKLLLKSSIVVNFDFSVSSLNKCDFGKNSYFINILNDYKINKKSFSGKNIVDFEIAIPLKYVKYQEILDGFNNKILYESIIYKHTIYQNIQKEIEKDNIQIMYLKDVNEKIIKKSNLNSLKALDKMII